MSISTRRLFTILLFISLFAMSMRPVADPDFWWHLKTGQWISQVGGIPHSDPFSFTRMGEPWIAHEWLSELLLHWLYQVGGYYLLIPLFSLIITISYFLIYLRSPGKPYVAGFTVLLAALASAPTWGVRPQMISLFLTASFLYILDIYEENRNWKFLLILPLLIVLWVNLHAGFFLGLFLIALSVFVELVNILLSKYQKEKQDFKRVIALSSVLIISILASLVNPNTYLILVYPFETLTSPSMMQFIQEWFSPNFHQIEWTPLALLLLAMIATPALKRRPTPFLRLFLVIFFAFASLRSMRFVPIFTLVAIPFISGQLAGKDLQSTTRKISSRVSKFINPIMLIAITLLVGLYSFSVIRDQPIEEARSYPRNAVAWIRDNNPQGNIYNTYGWGGYLIWRLYPDYPVFIDGRADIYGDDFIFNYMRIYSGQTGWQVELEKYDVEIVLIEPGSGLANVISISPGWLNVYEDTLSVIYIKK